MNPKPHQQPSLKRILILRLLGLTLVTTLVVTGFGARQLGHQLEQDAGEHLKESALRIRDGLESFLMTYQSAIGSVGEQVQNENSPSAIGRRLEQTLAHYPSFLTMLVADTKGNIIRACRRNEASFTPTASDAHWVGDRDYFLEPVRTGRPYTSGIFRGRGLGKDAIVALSSPVFNDRGKLVAVVEGSIDVTRIPLTVSEYHYPMLVIAHDATGRVVYSSKPKLYAPMQAWGGHGRFSGEALGELFRLEDPDHLDAKGRMVTNYAVRLPLQMAQWEVVSTTEVEEINKEVRQFYFLAAITVLILSVVCWQLAMVVARSISEPVVALVGQIQRYEPEAEQYSIWIPSRGTREIAQIGAEFEKMGARLRESFKKLRAAVEERDATNQVLSQVLEGLDQTVAERTAELAASEARYRQVVDHAGDIIYTTDADGRIQFHNPAFEKLFGPNMIGQRMLDFVEFPLRAEIQEQLRQQVRGRVESILLEFPVKNTLGSLRWIAQTTQLLMDETRWVIGFQAIARDVTERKLAEQALREAEERFALAVRGSNNGIWDWDRRSARVYYSDRWKQMFGIAPEQPLVSLEDWLVRVHPGDADALRAALTTYAQKGDTETFEHEHRMRHQDGSWRWVLTSAAAVRGEDGKASRIAGSTNDVTEGKLADPLTGLANRLAVAESLEQTIASLSDHRESTAALLFMDLDHFQLINDSMGHSAGNDLLFGVSRRIMKAVDEVAGHAACIGRLGGDEFAVVLVKEPNSGIARNLASAILEQMEEPYYLNGAPRFVSISIGIAYFEPSIRSAEEFLRNANTAMHEAKVAGRGRFVCFDQTMHARAVARLELETDLRRALEQSEFLLHYQAQVDLRTGRLSGFEALVRWQHPKRGMVPPIEFIGAAEENGLILPLGRWVIEAGVRELAAWDLKCESARDLAISINLSPKQFADPSLQSIIASVLAETGLDPSRLHLEITESMVASDPEQAHAILRSLSEMGVGLEIDDFGTGYSCLSQLHQLPFDTLKVDRSFVQAMNAPSDTEQDGAKLVESIVKLSASLDIEVIAEGIETEQHWKQLAHMGCQHGQGYYFSKPLPGPKALELLQERTQNPWPVPDETPELARQLEQLQTQLEAEQPVGVALH